jgi:hypothetical protein
MAHSLGFQGYIPTPLLLVQAAQQQVHSPMQSSFWMFIRLPAIATGTLVYLFSTHYPSPTLGKSFRAIVHPPY